MMKLNVIFLGVEADLMQTFSATRTKIEFMARGLIEQGASVVIMNSFAGSNRVNSREVENYSQIGTITTYPRYKNLLSSWRMNRDAIRNDLKNFYRPDANNIIISTSPQYYIYMPYCHYAHKYGYKMAIISHEWLPTIKGGHPLWKPHNHLYASTFGIFADAILPISEYIIDKIQRFNKPYFKVPVLAEFKGIPEKKGKSDFFLYCVFAAYYRVILPLIDAFIEYQHKETDSHKLVLVLAGSDEQVNFISEHIQKRKASDIIEIRRNVPYKELTALYENALGLIIPLDPDSKQDHARFSQKIAEYTSAASPIISCKVGEVDHYFTDRENAILCDYNPQSFAKAFKWISDNPGKAKEIGVKGYELGDRYFNYKSVGKELYNFLLTV